MSEPSNGAWPFQEIPEEEGLDISEAPLDIPYLKQQIKDIGYELVSYTSEPYEKKGFFHFGR